jgi:primosomal protein N' (replication factor Y)
MKINILLPIKFDQAFTYSVDASLDLKKGDYVLVPFRSKEIVGVVWEKDIKAPKNIKIKKIISKINFPSLSEKNIEFIKRFSEYNLSSLGMTFKLFFYEKGFLSLLKNKNLSDYEEYNIQNIQKENLSQVQKKSLKEIIKNLEFKKYSTTLIHGVTGSGKTLIYFEIIKQALKKNAQVLVLLPEIALTKQIAQRFKDYFGAEPALWHSSIGDKKKKIIWKGVSENKIKLVLGARSAIFLPFQDLKLIVIDEEHDSSYKQEEGVSYNARDMSILKASIENFPVLLISATPSVESYYNSKNNKYFYVSLNERYKNISLPKIQIVDLVKEPAEKGKFISNYLIPKIRKIIEEKNQVLFFLNRRGHSTYIMCYDCKKRLVCPNCSLGLIFHQSSKEAICHYCDYKTNLIQKCNNNKNCDFTFYGLGIERIFEEVQLLFPEQKIQIFSSDSIHNKDSEKIIKDIEDNNIPILVGTQLISKGFHFPSLNCIVVVNSDTNFLGSDIRASEKNFQLLQQLSGRAGREENKAVVFLQTNDSNNKILHSLSSSDPKVFYEEELAFRKKANLPPFSKLISVILSGINQFEVMKTAKQLKHSFSAQEKIKIFGPVTAPIFKIRGKYRVRLLLKYNLSIFPQKFIKDWLNINDIGKNIKLEVDVDPINFL